MLLSLISRLCLHQGCNSACIHVTMHWYIHRSLPSILSLRLVCYLLLEKEWLLILFSCFITRSAPQLHFAMQSHTATLLGLLTLVTLLSTTSELRCKPLHLYVESFLPFCQSSQVARIYRIVPGLHREGAWMVQLSPRKRPLRMWS